MSNQIRILHMISSLNIGGSQAFVMNLYRKINRNKIQFDFIIDHPEATYYEDEVLNLGGKVYCLPTFRGTNIGEIKTAWEKFFTEHTEYKVLHSHSRSYASVYLPIAKAHCVKTIIHSHNTSDGKGMSAIVKRIFQFPLRYQADFYMACSYAAGEWLFGKCICKSKKFRVVQNAINTCDFVFSEQRRIATRKELGIADQFVLGFLARVSEQKNPLFVIEVMRYLAQIKENVLLLFVGDGELLTQAKQKTVELGLAKNVIFTGARSDVGNMLAAMDCYILPSLWEGLGISLIEAQAAGLQCICSDAIQDEAILTDRVVRYPLSFGAQYWAEQIAALEDMHNRLDCSQYVRDAGFDIEENAQWMQKFYAKLHYSCS